MNISILLPNKQKKYLIKHIKDNIGPADELILFNTNYHQLTECYNQMILKAKNDYIILIDPSEKNFSINSLKNLSSDDTFFDDKIGVVGFKKDKFIKINSKCSSHKDFQKKVIMSIDPNLCLSKADKIFKHSKISIIIPYMYNGDRWEIFNASINNLVKLTKKQKNIEIVIHETGINKTINDAWIKKHKILYGFSKWIDVFHRGWSLNYAAKNIATGDLFVFMDADLIVDKQWINSIKKVTNVSIGWSEMINLNQKGTKSFIDNNVKSLLESSYIERVRKPNVYGAAGGITIFPKEIFYEIKGWCEDYYGTYGGEDNSTLLKLKNFGYNMNIMDSRVFHLYHAHTTFKHPKRFEIFNKHKKWDTYKWRHHVYKISKWGESSYEIIEKEHPLKILWCKIDTSNRIASHYDALVTTLNKKCHIDILTHDLQGLHPADFQKKCLSKSIKRPTLVANHLKENPSYDFIVCANIFAFNNEKWNQIKIPKACMLEDQHGNHNLAQVRDMIDDQWIVLHRYQLNKFHTDLYKHTKCIWFPHSVDISVFKDYRQRKKYDLLQTGALYQVYETRHFMKNTFIGDPIYHQIERPKEGVKNPWPVGIEYAKELNKAYMNVCCGSIYQYPVMKYFEIPACNSVIFGDWFNELEDLGFKPYKNMFVIDKDNVKLQVEMLLSNKKRLKEVSQNGYNLIREKHTTEHRANDLIRIIRENIHEKN